MKFSMEGASYDFGEIKRFIGDNEDALKQMLCIFIESAPATLKNLNTNFQERDAERVNYFAHKLKTSIDLLNITALKKAIRDIEHLSIKVDNLNLLQDNMNIVNLILPEIIEEVKDYLNK